MPRFRTAVAAVVWAFAPAGLYLVSAMQPQTVGYSGRVALVAIGIGILGAIFKRRGAAVGLTLAIGTAVVAPKAMWMVRVGRCGMNEQ